MRNGDEMVELTKLKRLVEEKIYSNPTIIELLDNPNVDPEQPDTALWECIFPYAWIPGVQEEVNVFVCIQTSIPMIYEDNNTFGQSVVTISIICARDKMRVKGYKGTRLDVLAGLISKSINWDRKMGPTLTLMSNIETHVNENCTARVLKFEAPRLNDIYGGYKLPNIGNLDE